MNRNRTLNISLVETHNVPSPINWRIHVTIGHHEFCPWGKMNEFESYIGARCDLGEILSFEGFRHNLDESSYNPKEWVRGGLKLDVLTIEQDVTRPWALTWKRRTWAEWCRRGYCAWLRTGRNLTPVRSRTSGEALPHS